MSKHSSHTRDRTGANSGQSVSPNFYCHFVMHHCHWESTPVILGEFVTMHSQQVSTHMSPFTTQCTPDISQSCISRSWVYHGRTLDPFFCTQRHDIFHEIAVTPWTQFAGDNFFSRNLLTAIAFVPVRRRQFSRNQLEPNAGWNTCCAMVSHARRSIDTSIVTQIRVQLIHCQC